MWFSAISPQYTYPWLQPFIVRLLQNDPATLCLLRHNPFPKSSPRYVRAQLYRYRFTTFAELRRDHAWWHRTLEGGYVQPISLTEAASTPPGSGD